MPIIDLPSQEEQDIAEKYCCDRILERPDTDMKKAVKYIIGFFLLTTIITICIYFVLDWLGNSIALPFDYINYKRSQPTMFLVYITSTIVVILLFFCRKKIVIGCVKLYQHYANEEVRRRCLFKPTCSEYTILAVKKYGVIRGLYKSYDRLFNRCKGNIYRIDYP